MASSLTQRQAVAVGAALTAAAVPWLTLLAPVGYNEGGLLLYGTLAIGWALRAGSTGGRAAVVRFAVAGAMAGFACGVKLTAVPMLLAAVPVAFVIAFPRQFVNVAVYIVVGSVVFAPWAVRNLAWAKNPVFPEGMRLLGQAHFSATQVERWERAHSPRPDQRSPWARLSAFGQQVPMDWRYCFALPLFLGLFGAGYAYDDRRARALYALFLLMLLFWLGLTHLQGRFFVIAVPVAALLVAVVDWGRAAAAVAVLAAACTVASWVMVHHRFGERLYGSQPLVEVLGVTDLSGLHPAQVTHLPPGATLSLIGEAKTFVYQHPMRVLRYRTVFDVDPAAGPDVVSMWRGRTARAPDEWELIHPEELQRFADTYFGVPQAPAELKGRTDLIVVPPVK